MRMKKTGNTAAVLARYGLLQLRDVWQYLLIEAGAALAAGLFIGVIALVEQDSAELIFAMPGVLALVAAAFLNVLPAGCGFSIYFKLGVHMGMTRRSMLAGMLGTGLAMSAVMVAGAAALNGLAVLAGRGMGTLNVLGYLPAWAWAALVYLPVAVGLLGGSVLLRFGRKGFWALYIVFMAVCIGPSLLNLSVPDAVLDLVLAALPWLLPAAGAVLALAGAALLWAVPFTD